MGRAKGTRSQRVATSPIRTVLPLRRVSPVGIFLDHARADFAPGLVLFRGHAAGPDGDVHVLQRPVAGVLDPVVRPHGNECNRGSLDLAGVTVDVYTALTGEEDEELHVTLVCVGRRG